MAKLASGGRQTRHKAAPQALRTGRSRWLADSKGSAWLIAQTGILYVGRFLRLNSQVPSCFGTPARLGRSRCTPRWGRFFEGAGGEIVGSADCEARSAHFPRREPKEPRANAGLFFSSCRWCRATSHRIGRSRSRSMRSAHQQCRSDCPSLSNVSACGSSLPCCCDKCSHATYDAACDALWYRQSPVPGRLCLRLRKLLSARSYQFSLRSLPPRA